MNQLARSPVTTEELKAIQQFMSRQKMPSPDWLFPCSRSAIQGSQCLPIKSKRQKRRDRHRRSRDECRTKESGFEGVPNNETKRLKLSDSKALRVSRITGLDSEGS